jgi:hypothetical protein
MGPLPAASTTPADIAAAGVAIRAGCCFARACSDPPPTVGTSQLLLLLQLLCEASQWRAHAAAEQQRARLPGLDAAAGKAGAHRHFRTRRWRQHCGRAKVTMVWCRLLLLQPLKMHWLLLQQRLVCRLVGSSCCTWHCQGQAPPQLHACRQ